MVSTYRRSVCALLVATFVAGCSGPASQLGPSLAQSTEKAPLRRHASATCTVPVISPEWGVLQQVASTHAFESTPTLQQAGKVLLQDIQSAAQPRKAPAPLPANASVPANISDNAAYTYATTSGQVSPNPALGFLEYDAPYQNLTAPFGSPPQQVTAPPPAGSQSLWNWGLGSLMVESNAPLGEVGSNGEFLGDFGNEILVATAANGGSLPAFYTTALPLAAPYNETPIAILKKNVSFMLDEEATPPPTPPVTVALGDHQDTNRLFRYADAYLLAGEALVADGDSNDGCQAVLQSEALLDKGLSQGEACLSGDDEVFPESPNSSAPTCSEFDSSYQGVSLALLLWYYLNMGSGVTVAGATANCSSQCVVLTNIIHGMNREGQAIQYVTESGTIHNASPANCYGSTFKTGEIDECGNSRVYPGGSEATFDAAHVTQALELYGVIFKQQGSGTTWLNIADQVAAYYTGSNGPADPNQAFYL